MLSETQQRMILKMYIKQVTTGNGVFSRVDVSELYSSKTSFYRGVKYLMDSGLVHRVELKVNHVGYKLTMSGNLLARILCSLHDNPTEIRGLKFSLRF